jgi:Transposase DDE domain
VLFESDLHAKRVFSIASATLGVVYAASLAVHAIGSGLAAARGVKTKHAVKQVDRLLSNVGVNVWTLFANWVPFLVGARVEIVVALDWTEHDHDDHSTIALNLITSHGRATPLLWLTVVKSELTGQRNAHEDRLLQRLHEVLPKGVKVTILADRGFGDQKLYELLAELGFDYVVRFREIILVTNAEGKAGPAATWVLPTGRPHMLKGAAVTQDGFPVPAVVVAKDPGMKEAWCLATSRSDLTARATVKLYGKRFSIEENFRDSKDIHFGMGLSATHIGDIARRDRLLLLSALAVALLTLLGAAGESLGYDRWIKVNTAKKRTHSLFRQGQEYYALIPNMKEQELVPLIERFGQLVAEQPVCREAFGIL